MPYTIISELRQYNNDGDYTVVDSMPVKHIVARDQKDLEQALKLAQYPGYNTVKGQGLCMATYAKRN